MNNENLTPCKYRRYGDNFKRSVVELLLHGDNSVEQIATELGSTYKASISILCT
jgi:transposase-like protein